MHFNPQYDTKGEFNVEFHACDAVLTNQLNCCTVDPWLWKVDVPFLDADLDRVLQDVLDYEVFHAHCLLLFVRVIRQQSINRSPCKVGPTVYRKRIRGERG